MMAVVAVMTAGTVASASVLRPGVWVNGRAFDLVTGEPPTTADRGDPLYIIASIDPRHPQHPSLDAAIHDFGSHDHVFALPAGRDTFSGVCDQLLVVPGQRAKIHVNVEARQTATPIGKEPLLFEARLGNKLVQLTSVARIRRAKTLDLARLIHTNLLACTITPNRRSG